MVKNKRALLVMMFLFLIFTPLICAQSAEEEVKLSEKGFVEGMTHAKFARLLVKELHAEGFLPAAGTINDIFKFWEGIGVVPPKGWNAGAEITSDDLISMLGLKAEEVKDLSFEGLLKRLIQKLKDVLANKSTVKSISVSPLAPAF